MTLTESERQIIEQNRLAAISKRKKLANQGAQKPSKLFNQLNDTLKINNLKFNDQNNPTDNNPTNLSTNRNDINRPPVYTFNRVQAGQTIFKSLLQPNASREKSAATPLDKNNNQITEYFPAKKPTSSTNLTSSNQPQYSINRAKAKAASNVNQNSRTNPPDQPNASYRKATALDQNNSPIAPANENQNLTNNHPLEPKDTFNRINSRRSNQPDRLNANHGRSVVPVLDQNNNQIASAPAKRPAAPKDDLHVAKRAKTGPQANKTSFEQITSTAIKFTLVNNREFVVSTSNKRVHDEVQKNLNPVRSDAAKKTCVFELEHYQETHKKLAAIKLDRLIIKLGEGFSRDVLEILEDSRRYDTVNVNLQASVYLSSVLKRLFPYQKEGVIFGVKREGRCLIADDMGLGKTMQAIALALYYFEDWPLLIVCPASVKFQWVAALLDWVPGLKRDDILEIDSKKKDSDKKNYLVFITSYDSVTKVEPYFSKKAVNCAILDECHMIKESGTQRFHNINKLAGKAKRLILVSGTPAMSRPIELFTQLNLLLPKIFSNKSQYATRYCDPKDTPWGRQYTGCTRPEELRVILESTVMVRRMKGDILNELPPKRRVKINLDAHILPQDRSEIEKFNSRFKGPQEVKMNDNGPLMNAYARTATIKLKPVLNYLELVLEKDKKFILFAYHRAMIDGVCKFLTEKKISFIKIDGSTPTKNRQASCELFQTNANCRAAVLSISAAGVGLTLTAAQLVLFAELYYNPGALIQAEDRAHRIGQKDSVYIEYLLCPGTTDDALWTMVHKKLETLGSLGIQSDGFQVKSQQPNLLSNWSLSVAPTSSN